MRDCKKYSKNDKLLFSFLGAPFSVSFVFFHVFFLLFYTSLGEYEKISCFEKNRHSNSPEQVHLDDEVFCWLSIIFLQLK